MSYKQYRPQVWAKTNGHCWYCGKQMNPFDDFTIEHQDARNNGGGDELANLVPACNSCNSRKNTKGVEEFRAYLVSKGDWRFWGEKHTHQLPEAQEERTAPDDGGFVYTCPVSLTWLHILSIHALPRMDTPSLAFTALALFEHANAWTIEPLRCYGWISFAILRAYTVEETPTILGCLYRLEQVDFFKLEWTTEHGFAYSFDIDRMKQAAQEAAYRAMGRECQHTH